MICYYLKNLNEIKNKLYEMPLSYALSRIIFHLNPYPQNNLQKSFSLANFHKAVSSKNCFYRSNSEKDPIDFIVFLLDFLHEEDRNEMGRRKNNNNAMVPMDNSKLFNFLNYLRENEHSIIFDNFCWINRTLKICTKCNSKFFNYQRYFTFDLKLDFENGNNNNNDINYNININNIINNNENSVKNIIEKQMKDKKILNYCQRCKKKTDFKINKSIIFFPNAFIFLIEKSNQNSQLKIDEKIEFINEKEKIEYKLNGIIAYNESKAGFKYIAYCLNSINNNWYMYDDQNTVSSIEKSEFLNCNFKRESIPPPTILFYQKI
jgi:ubiquitin C-terminal hydrolase